MEDRSASQTQCTSERIVEHVWKLVGDDLELVSVDAGYQHLVARRGTEQLACDCDNRLRGLSFTKNNYLDATSTASIQVGSMFGGRLMF